MAGTESFLAYLFNPKKSPKPKGLRARPLKGLKGGRKAGRLAAYNRMSAINQELLKQSGLRDEYLRGEFSLKEARTKLRDHAVNLGLAKPTRPKPAPHIPQEQRLAPVHQPIEDLRRRVIAHRIAELTREGVYFQATTIGKTTATMDESELNIMLRLNGKQMRAAAASRTFEHDNGEINSGFYR